MTPQILTEKLWSLANGSPEILHQLSFTNTQRQLPSVFQVGAMAAATVAAQAAMAAEIWRLRGGTAQRIEIDQAHALAAFRSERYLLVDGKTPPDPWSPIAGFYQAGDGRWMQLHTNFPQHRDGVLRILECADHRAAVAAAIKTWRAADLDARLAEAGLCAAMIRSPEEWLAHPQAAAIAALPLFDIERIADAPPQPMNAVPNTSTCRSRPLSGIRVLDLSRVIAAPVAGRTLAQHGAEVLAISAAHLPNIPVLVIDNSRGKRSAQLDLRVPSEMARLHELIRGADIFLHAYRPGTLAQRGLSSATLQALRPGLIEISLSAYSHRGPWAERRGFDSLVQSATGIAWTEGQAIGLDGPGKLPCQALDHATGYLAALCAMAALKRRAIEGGGWRARVSLAQTGAWLQAMERLQPDATTSQADLTPEEIARWISTTPSPFGMVSAIAPVETMRETPPYYALPPTPLDAYPAAWV